MRFHPPTGDAALRGRQGAAPARMKITLKSAKIREGTNRHSWFCSAESKTDGEKHWMLFVFDRKLAAEFSQLVSPTMHLENFHSGSTSTFSKFFFFFSCMWECETWHHCWPRVPNLKSSPSEGSDNSCDEKYLLIRRLKHKISCCWRRSTSEGL